MSTSYELHLFRPTPGAIVAGSRQPPTAQGKELAPLDQTAIGDFLLSLGPAIRFGAQTELGEQYLYEDEIMYNLDEMMRTRKLRILIVDDESEILRLFESVLSGPYQVQGTSNGTEALAAVERDQPDLVVLDLLMPGLDGFEVCRRLRRWSQVPIIVLSGRDRPGDKVRALDLGADDYLTKPFSVEELLARIRAILRRVGRPELTGPPTLVAGELRIDFDRQQVSMAGREVRLTPTEFNLLRELAAQPGKLMTHRMLLQRVWGPEYRDELEYLRVFVRRLRRKIEPDPDQPRYILTESRAGYRFHVPEVNQAPGEG